MILADVPREGGHEAAEGAADPRTARHAHDFLAPVLYGLVAEVRRAGERAAESRRDPEAIHDLRVALRRLRTLLRPARRAFGKRRLREIGGELRRFAQATGALRDEEVLRETLSALTVSPRARAELDAWLTQRARQERVRRRAVIAALRSADGPSGPGAEPGSAGRSPGRGQGPSLATALAHLERRLGRHAREVPVAALAEEACLRAFTEVRAAAAADPRDAAAMHALRIHCKRLRYTAELFAPVLGEPAAAIAKASARLQKRLGELHDLDEAKVRVARARGLSAPAAAAVTRALTRARHESARRARAALAEELPKVAALLGDR